MCGIAGYYLRPEGRCDVFALERMISRLAHRGPDGAGAWKDPSGDVGLGHRRLSILDLSEAGAQPMVSASGRYVLTYNGEIYNFAHLRRELEQEGFSFRGHSDTEVMLAAFERWGVETAVHHFRGMFAFAVWDRNERLLWLVRDRIGIKPLYYAETADGLVFASELRAIHAFNGTVNKISAPGLCAYLQYGYIPAPLTIFQNVSKLRPGSLLCVSDGFVRGTTSYWNVIDVARGGVAEPIEGDDVECVAVLERELRRSVREHMVSDVPIGAFLSGGVDSSTVTALMQAESSVSVNTFSIGFAEQAYNEAGFASAVARHLGTHHTELYVSERDAQSVIPDLPDIYDEPFSDISQIPTYLLSRLARQHVTVVLTGDGGDELFGGYNRYLFVSCFWRRLALLPLALRRILQLGVRWISPNTWDDLFHRFRYIVPWFKVPALPGQKMYKIASLLGACNLQELQDTFVSQWPAPSLLLHPSFANCKSVIAAELGPHVNDPVASQMLWDMHVYLVDDILTKVDRASMHVGLEARVPLLDHLVIETAWRVPLQYKIRNGSGKWILRRVLEKYVPLHLFERPKMGFGVPIDEWLRGGLRDWAEELLTMERLEEGGYLLAEQIRAAWTQHLGGRVNRGTSLWTILMFQAWRDRMRQW